MTKDQIIKVFSLSSTAVQRGNNLTFFYGAFCKGKENEHINKKLEELKRLHKQAVEDLENYLKTI